MLLHRAVQQRNHLRSWQNVARPSFSIAVSNVLYDLKCFYGHIYLQERAAIDHLHTALPQKPNNSWMFSSDSGLLFYFFFREMTGRTSPAFPIPFVFLLLLVLVALTSLTLLSSSISSEHFHVPGFIQRENRAETEVCFVGARASLEMRLLWGFWKSPFGSEPDTPCGRNPSTYSGWSHAGGKSSKCCCRPVFSTMVFSIEDLKGLRKKKSAPIEGQSNWNGSTLSVIISAGILWTVALYPQVSVFYHWSL